jgi:hypothetical protein
MLKSGEKHILIEGGRQTQVNSEKISELLQNFRSQTHCRMCDRKRKVMWRCGPRRPVLIPNLYRRLKRLHLRCTPMPIHGQFRNKAADSHHFDPDPDFEQACINDRRRVSLILHMGGTCAIFYKMLRRLSVLP